MWSLGVYSALSAEIIQAVLFYGFAALAVLGAWAIVLSGHIVRMAVYLLMTLAGVAGLYFVLGAQFLGAIQLLIYAGGTLILIVFGVMLTSRLPGQVLAASRGERLAGLLIAAVLGGLLLWATAMTPLVIGEPGTEPAAYGSLQELGREFLGRYLAAFEAAGVILLAVMIGAGYMGRRRSQE